MFGASPGIFRKMSAAKTAAVAYGSEERVPWTVVCKVDETENKWYSPCRKEDIERAQKEGWDLLE